MPFAITTRGGTPTQLKQYINIYKEILLIIMTIVMGGKCWKEMNQTYCNTETVAKVIFVCVN